MVPHYFVKRSSRQSQAWPGTGHTTRYRGCPLMASLGIRILNVGTAYPGILWDLLPTYLLPAAVRPDPEPAVPLMWRCMAVSVLASATPSFFGVNISTLLPYSGFWCRWKSACQLWITDCGPSLACVCQGLCFCATLHHSQQQAISVLKLIHRSCLWVLNKNMRTLP